MVTEPHQFSPQDFATQSAIPGKQSNKKEGIKLVVIAGLGAAIVGLLLLGTVAWFCQKRSVWEMVASTSMKCLRDLMFILQELTENSVFLLSLYLPANEVYWQESSVK